MSSDTRQFRVRARHEDIRHGRLLAEPSFEAAALAFVEHLPVGPGQTEIGVVVHDVATGHEHSFLIAVQGAETTSG